MAHLSLSFLGRFQVTLDGSPVASFESDKVRALLAYLSVEADHPHGRGVLAGLLWPEQPEQSARTNLRHVLLKLRQAIGDRDASPPFLLITRGTIQFNPASDHWLDVTAFSDLFNASQKHRHRRLGACLPCIRRLSQAAELYEGNFLEGFTLHDSAVFEEWSSVIRERLHRQALDALYHLAAYHERRGEYDQAREYAVRQIQLEPWREEAHRQLMGLLALSGQRSAALAQYDACRRVLAEELGVEPTAETTALYEQIKGTREKGKKGRREERDLAPPLLGPSAPLHNLPPQLTSFVGREAELTQITERLSNPDYRLVTLVGPGGIGKTRLALAAAGQQVGMFQHGVWFVSLAGLDSAESLVPAIAGVLNVPLHGGEEPDARLLAYLHDKEMLLVLDDFEHLLDGTDLVLDILRGAPQIVILITSRQRLNVQAEYVIGVEGLALPPPPRPSPYQGEGVRKGVESYSAVQLFVERADQTTRSGFALSAETIPDVVRVCQLVEGMPLAIELAAALADTYSCADIARSIRGTLDFLATTMRDVPPRHRSMRAVFESSWGRLSEAERRVLAHASVFRGGFTQEAALAVIGHQLPVNSDQLSVNSDETGQSSLITDHCLLSLVDKSLLRRTASGRYEMHELLRQFAAEKLEIGDWRLET
ncbi:MAG: SARP family transcriptional regulator, partial [Chloroflexi bacterium]